MTINELIDQIEFETEEGGNTRQRIAEVLRMIIARNTNGITPHVGNNRNWHIGAIDTGISAEGKDGVDGDTPHIGENGNWWVGVIDTEIRANGKDFEPVEIEESSTTPVISLEEGAYYKLGEITSLSLRGTVDSVLPTVIRFSSGETPVTIITPSNLKKQKYFSEVLTLTNTTFEISIVENRITATPFDHDTV